VFIFPPVSHHCAAEDPQPTISEQDQLKSDSAKKSKKADVSHLELYGTVILGEKKSALIFDNSKQRMDGVQEQDNNRRAGVYYLGDSIGGYVLSAIEEKRVILDYQGEKVTLTLSEGKEATTGEVTPLEEKKPGPATPPQQKAGGQGEKRKKSGTKKFSTEPVAPVDSPIMSPEEAEEVVEKSREILEDIKKNKGDVDQAAIDAKKEELRKLLMEKLEKQQGTGKKVQ
jgi:hypothetical protein